MTDEDSFARGITSSLAIKDYTSSRKICEVALNLYPQSLRIQSLLVRTLAEEGEIQKAIELYGRELSQRPLADNFSLLESIAWGHLQTAGKEVELWQLPALAGASMTHDTKAVEMLAKALNSSNAAIRAFALKFVPEYNDRILQREVLALMQSEKNWFVRQELMEAVGKMRLKEGKGYLENIIQKSSSTHEEKLRAISSLVRIYDQVNPKDLDLLLKHKKAGLREFALALIDHFDIQEALGKLFPLFQDPSPAVRMGLLGYLATGEIEKGALLRFQEPIEKLLLDNHPKVSILAAFLLLKIDEEKAFRELRKWVTSEDIHAARFAAAAIGAGGMKTSFLLQESFEVVKDPFVKANLAIGMLKLRRYVPAASAYLETFYREKEGLFMWTTPLFPMFKTLEPSEVRHLAHIPRYPILVDQFTRLDLLNLLCLVECSAARELIKDFLRKQEWGVSASASALLLQEGEHEALEMIESLLEDGDELIRIQAALSLAFYRKDPSAGALLMQAYPRADWERKIQILEALGAIGNRESIPFLLKVMQEPFQLLRTLAASSIIECLYH